MPRLLWLMFQVPVSSPQMTRMLGFFAVAVWAWTEAMVPRSASVTSRARSVLAKPESLYFIEIRPVRLLLLVDCGY